MNQLVDWDNSSFSWTVTFEIDTPKLRHLVELVDDFASKATITFTREKLNMQAQSAVNTMVISKEIECVSDGPQSLTVGVDVSRLCKVLQSVDSDEVSVELGKTNNESKMVIDPDEKQYEVEMINPERLEHEDIETLRQEDDVVFECTTPIVRGMFRAMAEAELAKDETGDILFSTADGYLRLHTEDKYFSERALTSNVHRDQSYSASLLLSITNFIEPDGAVEFSFGNESPLVVSTDTLNAGIAPRC